MQRIASLFSAEQLELLKSKFVERAECQDNHNKLDREITDIKVEMTKISTKVGIIFGASIFIATSVGALLIGAIGNLIFK